MKRVLLIFALVLAIISMRAELVVTSFRYNQSDATANTRNTERYDQNGERCALIKVETTQRGFVFDVGTLGVTDTEQQNAQHPSEIWVYVPHHVKRITIQHPQLGVLRDYEFPETIKSACTYIMKLGSGSVETIVHQNVLKQYLLFRVTPNDAVVDVTNESGEQTTWSLRNGESRRFVNFGKYQYRVTANLFYPEVGTVEVQDEENTQVVTVNLRPNHGWLKINTNADLQDAVVYIDDKQCGTVPYQSDKLQSGEYTLRLVKPMYRSYTQRFTIVDNKTLTLTPAIEANFAELTLNVANDAEIWVDGEKLATGQWAGNLEVGEYKIETKLASHRSQTKMLTVTNAMRHQTITLPAPIPIYGSLQVETLPNGATIYIDDKAVGQTPKYFPNFLVGKHKVKISKAGYTDLEQQITITEGQTAMLEGEMKEEKQVAISGDNGHEWVDLGLSVKWATCNIGAKNPEEYGNYYAWGEIATKENYQLNMGSVHTQNDIASANWGGDWRMPTITEYAELVANCKWTWRIVNGIRGYMATSKINMASIFLPAAGYRRDEFVFDVGSDGCYWSSTLFSNNGERVLRLYFMQNSMSTSTTTSRYYGLSVRAVRP